MSFSFAFGKNRHKAFTFHRYDGMTFVSFGIGSTCKVYTSGHYIHHMPIRLGNTTNIFLDAFWPVSNHWGTDATFV